MSEFDAKKLLTDNTVEQMTDKNGLDQYSLEQLQALHDAETAGQKRTTLLDPLHGAIKAKEDAAAAIKAKEDAAAAAKAKEDAAAAIKAKEDAAAAAKASKPKRVAKTRNASRKLELPARAVGVAIDPVGLRTQDEDADLSIVLADGKGNSFDGVEPMTFGPSDFTPSAGGAVLKRSIDLPPEGERRELESVWLLDGDEPIAVARQVVPLPFGGGRSAALPAESLRFDTPV